MEREFKMEILPKDPLKKRIIRIIIGHALALVLLELLLLYVTWSL